MKEKDGNLTLRKKNICINRKLSNIAVFGGSSKDFNEVCENSLLDTIQKKIIPEIEKSLK